MLVSVIIPTIGRPTVRRAVCSALAQRADVEVIVVVDRPDALAAVTKQLEGTGAVIVANHGRSGSAAARNVGVTMANGDYVAFCDDDDWWVPDKLAQQLALAGQEHSLSTVVVSPMIFHRRNGVSEVLPRQPYTSECSLADYLVARPRIRFGDGVMQSSSFLIPTGLMRATRWDESLPLHEDWDLLLRLTGSGEAALASTASPLVHVYQGSDSSLSSRQNWAASVRWLERYRPVLSRRAIGDFVAVHVLRAALAARDGRGVAYAARELVRSLPHGAALCVAASGLTGR